MPATQTPQGDSLAYSQEKEMWWKYTLIQLLEASPQPMSRNAIVEAVCTDLGLLEAQPLAFKVIRDK